LSLLGTLLGSNAALAWECCWATVGIKEWYTTYSPGGGLPAGSQAISIISLTIGGERLFVNAAGSQEAAYTNPAYPFAKVNYNQNSFNLGYMATSEVAITMGLKNATAVYSIPSYFGSDEQPITGGNIPIFGVNYSHGFEGTSFAINGNIAYGQTNRTAKSSPVAGASVAGTKSGSATYQGYELGASYALTQSFSFNLGYRVEQFDDLVPVNVAGAIVTLSMEKIKVSGATVGFAYKF